MNLILSKLYRIAPFLLFLTIFIYLYAPFTVIDDEGCLAFRDEATRKVYRSTVRVDDLPNADRRLLADGIICNDVTELAKVMENFLY